MKKIVFALIAFVLFSSHVMYLKLETYFLEPNTSATIQLFNGTFEKSENVIDRDRMLDASLLGNGERMKVKASQWTEKDSVTLLNFTTGAEGTWVAGISTAPRSIEMDADAFNTYLEHEGILDMLDWRRQNNQLGGDAVEKYSKHVKTIFQVGDQRSDDWQKALGYAIEFIPLDNPYELNTGDSLRVKLLLNGVPLANQLVYADYKAPDTGHTHDVAQDIKADHAHPHETTKTAEHSHDDSTEEGQSHAAESEEQHSHDDSTEEGHSPAAESEEQHSHEDKNKPTATHSHDKAEHRPSESEASTQEHSHDGDAEHSHGEDAAQAQHHDEAEEPHQHTSGQQLRTDATGMVTAKLTADGIWYLQTIHLVPTEEEGFTHESNWTTLTFEVVHGHGEDTHTHEHEEEEGIPSYLYWIGSMLLVGLLFFWFNRKN